MIEIRIEPIVAWRLWHARLHEDEYRLGRVSLWGRVVARENGFRAQCAYPYDLFVIGGNESVARALRRRYAVDVSLG